MYCSKLRPLVIPAVLTAPLYYSFSECERDRGELVLATARRLKSGLKLEDLRPSQTIDGMKVYTPKGNFGRFNREGLSVARVAAVEINCNYKEIIALWLDQSQRAKWDSSCTAVLPVVPVKSADTQPTQLAHFVEKHAFGNPLIPSRDYVIEVLQPYPAALVGKDTFTSLVFVNVDASDEIPRSWLYVRAKQNSILLLEPKGERATRVTFCIEKEPGGWALSGLLNNLGMGASPVLVLRDLKRALEKDSVDKDAGLTPEEVAQRNFKEKLNEWKKGQSIVDDFTASKEDLLVTISLLEERLKRIRETERGERMDLSELKGRIKQDLMRAKANLKAHK